MKKENPNDYELFYMELSQADYLNDIEIQDEYDIHPDHNETQGLSEKQVSEIAKDSLEVAKRQSHSYLTDQRDSLPVDQG